MKYNPDIQHRRTIRLKNYDYSLAGAYFITICVQNKEGMFGKIADSMMVLNDAGEMIADFWNVLPTRFPSVDLDAFVVMPNHIHGIVVLVRAPLVGACNDRAGTNHRATTRVAPTDQ